MTEMQELIEAIPEVASLAGSDVSHIGLIFKADVLALVRQHEAQGMDEEPLRAQIRAACDMASEYVVDAPVIQTDEVMEIIRPYLRHQPPSMREPEWWGESSPPCEPGDADFINAAQAARDASHAHKRLVEVEEENARLRASLEVVKLHAVSQDCGRMCDANPKMKYREQWARSEEYVDNLIRQALSRSSGEVGGDGEMTKGEVGNGNS